MTLSSNRLRLIGVFAALNLALGIGGWMALVAPQQSSASDAKSQAQLLQTQLQTLTSTTPSGSSSQQTPIHTSGIYSLDTALPSREDETALLFVLDNLAGRNDLGIGSIAPQPAQASPNGYTVLPINVALTGTYYHVTAFMRELRLLVTDKNGQLVANGPLFAVTSVGLDPAAGATGSKNKDTVTATLTISAYFYGVTGGAAPPVSTTDTDTTTTSTTGG